MATPNYFRDDAAIAARAVEVPNADFTTGTNNAASNSCGLGINLEEGAVVGTPEQFTLLDQHGNARAAQISQLIGGSGLGDGTSGTLPDAVVFGGANDADGTGTVTSGGGATLSTLEAGWVLV